jgi:hypothetical protein
MVLSTENSKPPETIQTMPRTGAGQAAKARSLHRWASPSRLRVLPKEKGLRGLTQALWR